MRTLILYSSQYSTCKNYAIWISEQLNATTIDLQHLDLSIIDDFDFIIFGSSIYYGIHKGEQFISKHSSLFTNKTILLFDCGFTPYVSSKYTCYHLSGTLSNHLKLHHRLYIKFNLLFFKKDSIFLHIPHIDQSSITPLVKAINEILDDH